MSVRVTRKVGDPCRLWEFGWDLSTEAVELPISGSVEQSGRDGVQVRDALG